MTSKTANELPIHIASCRGAGRQKRYLFLKKEPSGLYRWSDGGEETDCTGSSIVEAIARANGRWKDEGIKMVGCGFRYTLPERDEHGESALFHQMAASYGSMNGVYYDEELGHNCFVQNASDEALELWHKLKAEGMGP